MKTMLHFAFWRRNRDKLAGLLIALLAIIPEGMPKDTVAWLAEQFPWVPIQVCWGLSVSLAVWRVWAGLKLGAGAKTLVERRRQG